MKSTRRRRTGRRVATGVRKAVGAVCVDLDERYGKQFKIVNEPDGPPAKPKSRDPWLREIKCRYGRIYPHGPNTLAAWIGPDKRTLTAWEAAGSLNDPPKNRWRRRALRLLAIPGVRRHQVGCSEATVTFGIDSPAQELVFGLLKPHRRRRASSPAVLSALKEGRKQLDRSAIRRPQSPE